MIISIDAEKAFEKVRHTFMIKKKLCIILVTSGTACLLTAHLSESKENHEVEKNINVEVCVQHQSYLEKRCKQV